MIPTDGKIRKIKIKINKQANKKNGSLIKRGDNSSPLFLYPPPPCLFWYILSIRSEEVLLHFPRVFGLHQEHKTGWK